MGGVWTETTESAAGFKSEKYKQSLNKSFKPFNYWKGVVSASKENAFVSETVK